MSFATNMRSVASRLLTKYGRPVVFTRKDMGDYNPATSDVSNEDTITYEGVAHPAPYTVAELATGTVTIKDIKLLLYTDAIPDINDTVIVDGDIYRVMNVTKVSAQGLDVIYQLQIRI